MRLASSTGAAAALLAASLPFASAQLYSDCNPTTNSTCPVDVGLANSTYEIDFTTGDNSSWTAAAYTFIDYGDNGAEFTINKATDAPTMHTDFYIFFGYVEVEMRCASGVGVVSSIVLESDDLDEVDWEWLGGNNTSVETNYFGKGNTTSYNRATYVDVDTPVDTFHTYGINWTAEAITWSIDGVDVRTLEYADALDGKNYPQTPARVSLGVWSAGTNTTALGTVQWAGGYTDFDDAPFTMYVKNVKIVNYNPAMNYNWTDMTGDYTSIDILNFTVADNTSLTTTATAASIASAAAAAESASSSGTVFSQSSSAAMSADRAWICSSVISLIAFTAGFALL